MNLPPGLPPLPPVPDGYDVNAWAYRGTNWNPGEFRNYAYYKPGLSDGWVPSFGMKPIGSSGHYIEAVREPAMPSAQIFATLDPENGEEVTACPECVQGYVQETGFDPCEKCHPAASGVEARVCEDIAARQRVGIAKYGQTVEQSPDDMLQHAYEEALDLAVYLKAQIERTGWRPIERAAQDLLSAAQLVRSVVLVSFQQGQHPRTTMDFGRFQTAIENMEAVLSPPAERSDHE